MSATDPRSQTGSPGSPARQRGEPRGAVEGRWTVLVALAISAFVSGSCGDLTSGGFGSVEVEVIADSVRNERAQTPLSSFEPAPGGEVARSRAQAEERAREGATRRLDPIVGSLTLRARVEIRQRTGEWLEVTGGPQEVALSLDGSGTAIIARNTLPTGDYDRARVEFGRVEAEVIRGLRVNGDTISGKIPVERAGGGRILLERPIRMEVTERGRAGLLVEMRAPRWLLRVDRLRRIVDRRDFLDLVRIRVRRES